MATISPHPTGHRATGGVPLPLGWIEAVRVPEVSAQPFAAKLDTGARTAALHAVNIDYRSEGGVDYVEFESVSPTSEEQRICLPLIEHRLVRSSNGHSELRPVVEIGLELGPLSRRIECTLTDRSRLRYPMILGRTALAGIRVDPTNEHVLAQAPVLAS